MIAGIPNRPLYFYQKNIIASDCMLYILKYNALWVVWFYRHICIDIIIHSNMTNDSNDHGPFMLLIFLTWDTSKNQRFSEKLRGFQWIQDVPNVNPHRSAAPRVTNRFFPRRNIRCGIHETGGTGWRSEALSHSDVGSCWCSGISMKKPMETSIKLAFARMMFSPKTVGVYTDS